MVPTILHWLINTTITSRNKCFPNWPFRPPSSFFLPHISRFFIFLINTAFYISISMINYFVFMTGHNNCHYGHKLYCILFNISQSNYPYQYHQRQKLATNFSTIIIIIIISIFKTSRAITEMEYRGMVKTIFTSKTASIFQLGSLCLLQYLIYNNLPQ